MIDRRIGKIKVRRGTDIQRKLVTFEEGELVYSIDKQRLYIGNGNTQGGILVSNRNYVKNFLGEPPIVPPEAVHGDIVYDKSTAKTYITKCTPLSCELILIADAGCCAKLQNEINTITDKIRVLSACATVVPPIVVPTKLTWYIEPSDISVNLGETVTFTASAYGGTGIISYKWRRKDGTPISVTDDQTSLIFVSQLSDIATYYCVANTFSESITSKNAVLSIGDSNSILAEDSTFVLSELSEFTDWEVTTLVVPTITLQPKSQVTTALVQVTFEVDATGSTPLNYQWRINGVNVAGETNRKYTISNPTKDVNGIDCVVSNLIGSVTSNSVDLIVGILPTIVTQPVSQTVSTGSNVTFSVVAGGSTPLSYQWNKDGSPILGATNSTYTINSVTNTDFDNYNCVVSNSYGSVDSDTVNLKEVLTIINPKINPNTMKIVIKDRQWSDIAMSSDGTIQTAVARNGYIYISTDSGDTWIAKETIRTWRSVSMSSDGKIQTAVGPDDFIFISTDYGNNWTPKLLGTQSYSVAISPDGTKQTAVSNLGQIYISTDSGDTWISKESDRYWNSIAISSDGKIQTAVAGPTVTTNNFGQIYVSTDSGNTWTPKESNRSWRSVAMSSDGTKQTAVAVNEQIYISTDSGNTWTPKESKRAWYSVAMSSDGTKQTAVANSDKIYISIDSGNTWTPKETKRNWKSVAMSSDGKIQAAVVDGGQIYVSSDFGETWKVKESIFELFIKPKSWVSVAMSSDATKQTAVVSDGQIYISSDSGYTWTPKESKRTWRYLAMSSDGKIQAAVALNDDNLYISKDSGNSWTPKKLGDVITSLYQVVMSSDGKIIMIGISNGEVYSSTDSGNTWTSDLITSLKKPVEKLAISSDGKIRTAITGNRIEIYSGNTWTAKETERNWSSVAMSSDGTKQTAVVDGGQIYISTDSGNTWTAKETNRRWNSVAMSSDGTIQAAVVEYGQIYISTDSGNTWTAKETNRRWSSVAMSSDGKILIFGVFGGNLGYIYESKNLGDTVSIIGA